MKQILFVDDEPLVLEGLQRMLHSMHRDWEMRFATSGTEALQMMATSPADVVISDMRMPHMNGAQLLNEIMRRYPKTIRLILSGYADMEMVMQCVGGTHQFLSKPCDGQTLRKVVSSALELDAWLNNDDLKALVSQLGKVPSMPTLYFKILKELESPEATLDKVGITISQDPGMTSKMLQMVNSAFFGLRRQLTNPTEAVLHLGLETIKSLVLGIHVFSEFETLQSCGFSMEQLWQHSIATAATARQIARLERQENRIVEESFTAGMLHDIGRLVLLANLPDRYGQAAAKSRDENIPLVDAERFIFGASHAEVGGYLLGLWGLPISLVETTVFHHCPGRCPNKNFSALTAVHVANVIEQPHVTGEKPFLLPQLDKDYLVEIGVWERVEVWRNAIGKIKTA